MKPEDFPMERLSQLEGALIGMADSQRERARVATQQGPAPQDHQAMLAAAGSPHGFYESALAYYESARALGQAAQDIVRTLVARAAVEPKVEHPWPIDRLQELTTVHEPEYAVAGGPRGVVEHHMRFPRWGVINDQYGDSTTTLTVTPASAVVGGVLLRAANGPMDPTVAAETEITIQVDFEEWDALNTLVQRIRAGELIPYDNDGNTHGPQPQESYR